MSSYSRGDLGLDVDVEQKAQHALGYGSGADLELVWHSRLPNAG
jgi:hypothetical protein